MVYFFSVEIDFRRQNLTSTVYRSQIRPRAEMVKVLSRDANLLRVLMRSVDIVGSGDNNRKLKSQKDMINPWYKSWRFLVGWDLNHYNAELVCTNHGN